MKKYFLLLILAALLPMVAHADESGTCGDNLTWTYYESTHSLVLAGSGKMYDYSNVNSIPWYKYHSDIVSVTLPEGLTSIGSYAFYLCSSLTSVTIPNSVTSIGYSAFEHCSGLTAVTIGKNLTSIGESAFYKCSDLTAVYITDLEAWCKISFKSNPLYNAHHLYLNGVEIKDLVIPNGVTAISSNAFSSFSGLTSVTIANSVKSIGNSVFYGCSNLISANIPNSVTSIGESAFQICGLTAVTIPNSVTSIGSRAFMGCGNLTSVTIPNSVTSISGSAFQYCSRLTSVTIPNSVTSIGGSAFSNCSRLTSVTIPNSVTSIDGSAFKDCSRLTSVTLSNNLMMIKKATFAGCSSLQKLIIPASVQYIYQEAFSGCNALNEIVAQPETPPFIYNDTFSNYNCTLKVPDAGKNAYLAHEIWSKFGTIQTISGEDIENPKCATPSISYGGKKLTFGCATEGVEYVYTIKDADVRTGNSSEVSLTATYEISVYATKTGYENSDVATATLVWNTATFTETTAPTAVRELTNSHDAPLLIQSNNGVITIQGADDGQQVRVYGINGTEAGAAVSSNGQAMVGTNLKPGSVAIIKIGDRSVKVVIK